MSSLERSADALLHQKAVQTTAHERLALHVEVQNRNIKTALLQNKITFTDTQRSHSGILDLQDECTRQFGKVDQLKVRTALGSAVVLELNCASLCEENKSHCSPFIGFPSRIVDLGDALKASRKHHEASNEVGVLWDVTLNVAEALGSWNNLKAVIHSAQRHSNWDQEVVQMECLMSELSLRSSGLTAQLHHDRDATSAMELEASALQEELQQMEQRTDQIKDDNVKLEQRVQFLQSQCFALDERKVAAECRVAQSKSLTLTLTTARDTLRSQLELQVEQLNSKIYQQQQRNSETDRNCSIVSLSISNTKTANDVAQSSITALRKSTCSLRSRVLFLNKLAALVSSAAKDRETKTSVIERQLAQQLEHEQRILSERAALRTIQAEKRDMARRGAQLKLIAEYESTFRKNITQEWEEWQASFYELFSLVREVGLAELASRSQVQVNESMAWSMVQTQNRLSLSNVARLYKDKKRARDFNAQPLLLRSENRRRRGESTTSSCCDFHEQTNGGTTQRKVTQVAPPPTHTPLADVPSPDPRRPGANRQRVTPIVHRTNLLQPVPKPTSGNGGVVASRASQLLSTRHQNSQRHTASSNVLFATPNRRVMRLTEDDEEGVDIFADLFTAL